MKGDIREVGSNTVHSASPLNIFRKGPVKAEIAGEWIASEEGRKVRAFYGREPDGEWRGQVEDIGHTNETSPFAFIRILDDEAIGLTAVEDMAGEMSESYARAILEDHRVEEDENYYQLLRAHLTRMLEVKQEMRKNLRAGMALLGVPR